MSSYGDYIITKNLEAKEVIATDIHSTGKIFWADFDPPLQDAGVSTLSSVLSASEPDGDANNLPINDLGGLAMTGDITMASNNMTGTGTIGCVNLVSSSLITSNVHLGRALSIISDADPNSGEVNFNVSSVGEEVELQFTGLGANGSTQDTKITGDVRLVDGVSVKTLCTHLDMTSTTNLLPIDKDDQLSFGLSYDPAIAVVEDSTNVLTYTRITVNYFATVPILSEPTRYLIDVSFAITDYGYGPWSVCLGLAAEGSFDPVVLPESTIMTFPHIAGGGVQAAPIRRGGYQTFSFCVDLTTSAVTRRLFPMVKSGYDDGNSSDNGRLIITIGGPVSAVTGTKNGPGLISARPVPTGWIQRV